MCKLYLRSEHRVSRITRRWGYRDNSQANSELDSCVFFVYIRSSDIFIWKFPFKTQQKKNILSFKIHFVRTIIKPTWERIPPFLLCMCLSSSQAEKAKKQWIHWDGNKKLSIQSIFKSSISRWKSAEYENVFFLSCCYLPTFILRLSSFLRLTSIRVFLLLLLLKYIIYRIDTFIVYHVGNWKVEAPGTTFILNLSTRFFKSFEVFSFLPCVHICLTSERVQVPRKKKT